MNDFIKIESVYDIISNHAKQYQKLANDLKVFADKFNGLVDEFNIDDVNNIMQPYGKSLKDFENVIDNKEEEEEIENEETEETSVINESKKINLKETVSIDTPKFLLNYVENDVVTAIKTCFKEYEKTKCLSISAVGEDAFYNVEFEVEIEPEYSSEIELTRFMVTKKLHDLRNNLFSDLSGVLPILGINLRGVQIEKNNKYIKSGFTILLSKTNPRDWVTGKPFSIDKKNNKKINKAIDDKYSFNESIMNIIKKK